MIKGRKIEARYIFIYFLNEIIRRCLRINKNFWAESNDCAKEKLFRSLKYLVAFWIFEISRNFFFNIQPKINKHENNIFLCLKYYFFKDKKILEKSKFKSFSLVMQAISWTFYPNWNVLILLMIITERNIYTFWLNV